MKNVHSVLSVVLLTAISAGFSACGTDNTHCSLQEDDTGKVVMTCPDDTSATLPPSDTTPIIGPNETLECELLDEETLQCDDVSIDLSDHELQADPQTCTLHGGTPPYLQCGDQEIPLDSLASPSGSNYPDDSCYLNGEDSAGNPILKCGDDQFALGDETTVTPVCSGGFAGDIVLDRTDHPILDILDASNCTIIRGNVIVKDYPNDTLPAAFHQIEFVYGDIEISSTDLKTLHLPNLKQVFGSVTIEDNSKLTNISEFPKLKELGTLSMVRNEALVNTGIYPALVEINYLLEVRGSPLLVALSDFSKLTALRRIEVSHNERLLKVGDFPNIKRLPDGFYVASNPAMTTLGDFSNVKTSGDESNWFSFVLQRLPSLTSISDFSALHSVGSVSKIYLQTVGATPTSLQEQVEALRDQLDEPGNLEIYY